MAEWVKILDETKVKDEDLVRGQHHDGTWFEGFLLPKGQFMEEPDERSILTPGGRVEDLDFNFVQEKTLHRMVEVEDPVNHPSHYTQHPSGIECIQITEHMSFLLGNVFKYVWRADLKNGVEDLKKARFYLDREIVKREAETDG